jgi:hypothetical protein
MGDNDKRGDKKIEVGDTLEIEIPKYRSKDRMPLECGEESFDDDCEEIANQPVKY